MNMTGVADLPVYVARPVVANQAQRLPPAPRQRQAARKVQIVIQILPLVDPVDRPVFRYGIEIPLFVPSRFLQPTGTGIPHSLRDRSKSVERIVRQQQVSHRTTACDRCRRSSQRARRTGPPRASAPIATILLRPSLAPHPSFTGRSPRSRIPVPSPLRCRNRSCLRYAPLVPDAICQLGTVARNSRLFRSTGRNRDPASLATASSPVPSRVKCPAASGS